MLAHGTLYVGVAAVTLLGNFLLLPFFTSLLTLADFGFVAMFFVVGMLFGNLATLGLTAAKYRFFFNLDAVLYRSFFSTIFAVELLLLGVFGCGVWVFAADVISDVILRSTLSADDVRLALINGVFHYFYVSHGTLLTAQKRAGWFVGGTLLHTAINLGLPSFLLLTTELRGEALVIGLISANAIACVTMSLPHLSLITARISWRELRQAIAYCYPSAPNLLIGVIYSSFDRSMLANIHGNSAVGEYEFGQKFANLVGLVRGAVEKVWLPFALSAAEAGGPNMRQEISDRFFEILAFIGLIGLGVSLFTEEVLMVLTTPEFHGAKLIVPVLVGFYIIGVINQMASFQIQFAKKLIFFIPTSLLSICLNVGLNLWLIPKFAAFGAAIATVIAAAIVTICSTIIGHRLFPGLQHWLRLFSFVFVQALLIALTFRVLILDVTVVTKILLKLGLVVSYCVVAVQLRWINMHRLLMALSEIKARGLRHKF